jgi:type II secretory pathway component PulF
MPTFVYSAKSQPASPIQGKIDANTRQEAVQRLTRMGYLPLSVELEESSSAKGRKACRKKISRKELAMFTGQLATLIESGVNAFSSFQILMNQTSSKPQKAILEDIVQKIKDGKSLSDCFSSHPQMFPQVYVAAVHIGEAGGSLPQVLRQLAEFLEREQEFQGGLKAALVYPIFVLVVSVATVLVLLGYVLPRLSGIFVDMGQNLPLPTQLLLATSEGIRNYWWLIVAAFGFIYLLLRRLFVSTNGRLWFDASLLKIPKVGELFLESEISGLFRTLSLLLSNAIPVVYALDISLATLQNQVVRREMERVKGDIAKGASFSQSFRKSNLFPPLVINVVTVSEESGTLDRGLLRVANEYAKHVERSLRTLVYLLEPLIILVMGMIVGFIVLSVLLPIFQINVMVS